MKTLLTAFVSFLFLFAINANAQDVAKNVNTIVLYTSYSTAEEALYNIAHLLMTNNISSEKMDKELTSIVTNPIKYKNIDLKLTFKVAKKNERIVIVCNGNFRDGAYYKDAIFELDQTWRPITNRGMKIENSYKAWEGLLEVVKRIPYNQIGYETR